jgi:hypothetical protein
LIRNQNDYKLRTAELTEKYHLINENNEFKFTIVEGHEFVLLDFTDFRSIGLIKQFLKYNHLVINIFDTIAEKMNKYEEDPPIEMVKWFEAGMEHAVELTNDMMRYTITEKSLDELKDDALTETLIKDDRSMSEFIIDFFDIIGLGIYCAFKDHILPNKDKIIDKLMKEKRFTEIMNDESKIINIKGLKENILRLLVEKEINTIGKIFGLIEDKDTINQIDLLNMDTIGNA